MSPKPARNLALGALVGALAGWAIALRRRRPKPQPVSQSTPLPAPEPAPAATAPFVLPSRGEWTVADVERLIAEHGDDSVEELGDYLESFRLVATPSGGLPRGVEVVLEDVFAELIARASKGLT